MLVALVYYSCLYMHIRVYGVEILSLLYICLNIHVLNIYKYAVIMHYLLSINTTPYLVNKPWLPELNLHFNVHTQFRMLDSRFTAVTVPFFISPVLSHVTVYLLFTYCFRGFLVH